MKPSSNIFVRTVALALFSTPLMAATSAPSAGGSVLKMLAGLAVVIVLMLALLRFLRQLQRSGPGGHHNPKIIGSTALGQRERVVLLEVANKVLVLGVSAQSIATLHSFDVADLPAPVASTPSSGSEFAGRLKAMLEKSRHGK